MLRPGFSPVLIGTLGSLVAAGCTCSSSGAPRPAASVAPLSALAASVKSATAAARKKPAELVMPPATPPDDAKSGPGGLRFELARTGDGDVPKSGDSVQADFSVWTQAGALAYTTYKEPGPVGFSATTVPPAFFSALSLVPVGSKAWFWLPAPFVHAVATQRVRFPYPDTALVLEYEPSQVLHHVASNESSPTPSATEGRAASEFPTPDAAGPPKTALTTPGGLKYVVLAPGDGKTKPSPGDKLDLRLTLWPVLGLFVGEPALLNQPSATTLVRAPAGLGQVLERMTLGGTARVWLPPAKAQLVSPIAQGREGVLDLRLEKIE